MLSRRKRKRCSDDTGTQNGTEEDEGPGLKSSVNAGVPNKLNREETSIVISDSDSLELEEDGISQKQKANHRKALAAKRKIARMTEEEQLALAVKISQQEQASHVKHREEEDELLKKAIAESLHNSNIHANSATVMRHDLTVEESSDEEDIILKEQEEQPLSQQSQNSSQSSSQNPRVRLTRLRQDILESTSVALSSESPDAFPCTESNSAVEQSSVPVMAHDLTNELSSGEEDANLKEQEQKQPFFQQSPNSRQSSSQSPKLLLKRFSQDSLDSSKVNSSSNYRDPFPSMESYKASEQNSADVMAHDLTAALFSGEQDIALQEQEEGKLFSQQSQNSSQGSSPFPKVCLTRLSQDIVESPSIILSPNCKESFPCIESYKSSSLSQLNSSDLITMSPQRTPLSPVFPLKSCGRRMIPCRLFKDNSSNDVSDKVADQCLEQSQRSQVDNESSICVLNNSELTVKGTSSPSKGLYEEKPNTKNAISSVSCENSAHSAKKQQNDDCVHYYWGIPFCPKGVDPSAYTQVIMCQLEVYEKSLKKVQRQLLHKTEFGQPIQLAASSENSTKDSQENFSQGDAEEILEDGEQQKAPRSPVEPTEDTDSSDTQPFLSKRSKVSYSPLQQTQEGVHSCPSEEENVRHCPCEPITNLLPDDCEGVVPVVIADSSKSPTDMKEENPHEEHIEDAQEETSPSSHIEEVSEQMAKPDLTDDIPVSSQDCSPNALSSQEITYLDPVCSQDVECPICGCKFSREEIEQHAAYCDGAKPELEMVALRSRKRLSRPTHGGSGGTASTSDSGKHEECYLCRSLVLLSDYKEHVDNCLQLRTQRTRRVKCTTQEMPRREGRLLSMLEQSEAISADGHSGVLDGSYMSPPREEHADSFTSKHLSISDSPIRSFVSISDARDCLVDFKKQFSHSTHQPNRGRAKHRGKGKKRRM